MSADSSPPQPGTRVLRLEHRSRLQYRPGQNTVREAFSGVAHLTPSETQTSLGFLALSSNGLCSILEQIIEVVCLLFPGWRAHQTGREEGRARSSRGVHGESPLWRAPVGCWPRSGGRAALLQVSTPAANEGGSSGLSWARCVLKSETRTEP